MNFLEVAEEDVVAVEAVSEITKTLRKILAKIATTIIKTSNTRRGLRIKGTKEDITRITEEVNISEEVEEAVETLVDEVEEFKADGIREAGVDNIIETRKSQKYTPFTSNSDIKGKRLYPNRFCIKMIIIIFTVA